MLTLLIDTSGSCCLSPQLDQKPPKYGISQLCLRVIGIQNTSSIHKKDRRVDRHYQVPLRIKQICEATVHKRVGYIQNEYLERDVAQNVKDVAVLEIVGAETEVWKYFRLLTNQNLLSYQANHKQEHREYLENVVVTSEVIISFLKALFVGKTRKGSIDND